MPGDAVQFGAVLILLFGAKFPFSILPSLTPGWCGHGLHARTPPDNPVQLFSSDLVLSENGWALRLKRYKRPGADQQQQRCG